MMDKGLILGFLEPSMEFITLFKLQKIVKETNLLEIFHTANNFKLTGYIKYFLGPRPLIRSCNDVTICVIISD